MNACERPSRMERERADEKGNKSELRVREMLMQLRSDGLPITRIRRLTGKRLDRKGIDFLVYLRVAGKITRVPLEVKSSETGRQVYLRKQETIFKNGGSLIIVANPDYPDSWVYEDLRTMLEGVIREQKSFESFFESIRGRKKLSKKEFHAQNREYTDRYTKKHHVYLFGEREGNKSHKRRLESLKLASLDRGDLDG